MPSQENMAYTLAPASGVNHPAAPDAADRLVLQALFGLR